MNISGGDFLGAEGKEELSSVLDEWAEGLEIFHVEHPRIKITGILIHLVIDNEFEMNVTRDL